MNNLRQQRQVLLRLKGANQITHSDIQRFGDLEHRTKRNLHVASLDLANEIVMKVSFLGQFLLGETSTLAIDADRLANDSAVLWLGWHSLAQNQEPAKAS